MRTYHPKSWSQQARELGDRIVDNVNSGDWCLEQARRFFVLSYRHPLIKQRAAKRFYRLYHAGKVHESPVAVSRWKEYKKYYQIEEQEEITSTYCAW